MVMVINKWHPAPAAPGTLTRSNIMANQNFGTVVHNGATIALTQQAYLHNSWYQAVGMDADANEYMVTWEIINPDVEDESDACDWSVYDVRPL